MTNPFSTFPPFSKGRGWGLGLYPTLQLLQVNFQSIKTIFPEFAVFLYKLICFFESLRFETATPPLRLFFAGNEAGAFEHLEVLGHSRSANLKRTRKLTDGDRPLCQARKHRAPRRVGERGKGQA